MDINTMEIEYIYTCCMTPVIIANRRNVSGGLSENCSYCLLTSDTCDCQLSEVSVGSCEVIITGYVN